MFVFFSFMLLWAIQFTTRTRVLYTKAKFFCFLLYQNNDAIKRRQGLVDSWAHYNNELLFEREESLEKEDGGFVTMWQQFLPAFLLSSFFVDVVVFTKEGRKRLKRKPHIIQHLFCCWKKVYIVFCVIDRCRVCNVRPANRYAIASCVYIKSHLLRTVRQERRRKRGCHDCHNYMERPTHGQGLYLPCPVAICQRKRGNKGNSGTDVSENLLFVVFFVFSKNI